MNEFLRGMATIGDLSPSPVSLTKYPPRYSEWQWVANSFARAGYNIWLAMKKGSPKGIFPPLPGDKTGMIGTEWDLATALEVERE